MANKKSKRIFLGIILLCLLISVAYFIWLILMQLDKKSLESQNKTIHLINLQGHKIEFDFNERDTTLLLFFNSECDLCIIELSEILNDYNRFSKTMIYLVSRQELKELEEVHQHYNFKDYPKIELIMLNSELTKEPFLSAPNPSVFLYGNKGELLFQKFGYTPALELARILNNDEAN